MGNATSSNEISNNSKIYGDNNISLLALIHFQKWDHIQHFLKQSNDQCLEMQSMLPIHYAFQNGAPLEVIKVLHEAYIKNIETNFINMSSYFNLVSTNTSNRAAPKEVIEFLHEKYPQGIETTTSEGNLLLHTACYNNASLDVIQYLLHHYPKGICGRNHYGRLAIHCACTANPSLEIIQYLCKLYPKGIEIPDNYGDYPIDVAFQHGASDEVVDYLSNFIFDIDFDNTIENSILDDSNVHMTSIFQNSIRRSSSLSVK